MKYVFDIYMIEIPKDLESDLQSSVGPYFNIRPIEIHEVDSAINSKTALVVFNYKYKDQIKKLKERTSKYKNPIVVYIDSSVETESSKIKFLEDGCDDLLVLDMERDEQIARLKKILQIYCKTHMQIIHISDFILDKKKELAIFKDKDLKLTTSEFRILYTLLDNHKNITSKDKIIKALKNNQKESSLSTQIYDLRKKLLETPVSIISHPKVGVSLKFD